MATSFKQPTSFWRKFRNWFVDPAPRSRRRHSRRPAFDALEDRTTPSATLLGSELLIGPINSTTNQWPSAAMDALGNSVAVWEYQGLAGRQFDSSGTALGPVTTLVPGVPFQ